jgi:hypothetical protein
MGQISKWLGARVQVSLVFAFGAQLKLERPTPTERGHLAQAPGRRLVPVLHPSPRAKGTLTEVGIVGGAALFLLGDGAPSGGGAWETTALGVTGMLAPLTCSLRLGLGWFASHQSVWWRSSAACCYSFWEVWWPGPSHGGFMVGEPSPPSLPVAGTGRLVGDCVLVHRLSERDWVGSSVRQRVFSTSPVVSSRARRFQALPSRCAAQRASRYDSKTEVTSWPNRWSTRSA